MKNCKKLLTVTFVLVGSTSLSHSQDFEYLEDDELYTQTSAELISSSAWGRSSNLSIMRKHSDPDNTHHEEPPKI